MTIMEEHYNALKTKQYNLTKKNGTYLSPYRIYRSHPKGSWMDTGHMALFYGHYNDDHGGRWYRICIMKTGQIITRNTRQIRETAITGAIFKKPISEKQWTELNKWNIYRKYEQTYGKHINPNMLSGRSNEIAQCNTHVNNKSAESIVKHAKANNEEESIHLKRDTISLQQQPV